MNQSMSEICLCINFITAFIFCHWRGNYLRCHYICNEYMLFYFQIYFNLKPKMNVYYLWNQHPVCKTILSHSEWAGDTTWNLQSRHWMSVKAAWDGVVIWDRSNVIRRIRDICLFKICIPVDCKIPCENDYLSSKLEFGKIMRTERRARVFSLRPVFFLL
jgi:hypothetical protein